MPVLVVRYQPYPKVKDPDNTNDNDKIRNMPKEHQAEVELLFRQAIEDRYKLTGTSHETTRPFPRLVNDMSDRTIEDSLRDTQSILREGGRDFPERVTNEGHWDPLPGGGHNYSTGARVITMGSVSPVELTVPYTYQGSDLKLVAVSMLWVWATPSQ